MTQMTTGDQLSIETPELIALDYELAGIGSRFMAYAIDVIFIALLLIAVGIGVAIGGVFPSSSHLWVIAAAFFAIFLLEFGYFSMFEIIWNGQTPGKRQAGIRVLHETGRRVTAFEVFIRNMLRIVDYLPAFYGLGITVMFCNSRSRRLGDFAAGTVVVHDTCGIESTLHFNSRMQPPEMQDASKFSSLTRQDVQLLETFLQRRMQLEATVRDRTAHSLVNHFATKCGLTREELPASDEDFLEGLVRHCREHLR